MGEPKQHLYPRTVLPALMFEEQGMTGLCRNNAKPMPMEGTQHAWKLWSSSYTLSLTGFHTPGDCAHISVSSEMIIHI